MRKSFLFIGVPLTLLALSSCGKEKSDPQPETDNTGAVGDRDSQQIGEGNKGSKDARITPDKKGNSSTIDPNPTGAAKEGGFFVVPLSTPEVAVENDRKTCESPPLRNSSYWYRTNGIPIPGWINFNYCRLISDGPSAKTEFDQWYVGVIGLEDQFYAAKRLVHAALVEIDRPYNNNQGGILKGLLEISVVEKEQTSLNGDKYVLTCQISRGLQTITSNIVQNCFKNIFKESAVTSGTEALSRSQSGNLQVDLTIMGKSRRIPLQKLDYKELVK